MDTGEGHGTRDAGMSSNVCGNIGNCLGIVFDDLSGDVALYARFRVPGAA
jgi:hypothetical protein